MKEENSLQDAISKLSAKKHVLHPDLGTNNQSKTSTSDDKSSLNDQLVLNELQQSMRLLMSFFYTSKFDELLCLLSQPLRLFVLNIMMGFLRGLGFSIACFICLYFILFFFFPNLLIQF